MEPRDSHSFRRWFSRTKPPVPSRPSKPTLECLETRELLSGPDRSPYPPVNPAQCQCSCVNSPGDLILEDTGMLGNNPSDFSSEPVRYSDGVVQLAFTDLSSSGFGTPWGQTRSWTNGPGYSDGVNGNGWVITQLPHLVAMPGGVVAAVSNGTTARFYDPVSGGYQARFFGQTQLTYSSSTHLFTLTDTAGDHLTFTDFSSAWSTNQKGQLQGFTDPQGNVTSVTSTTSDGRVAEIQRSAPVGSSTVTESWLYTYLGSTDANAGLLANVTLRRKVDAGEWTTVRQVQYTYYNGTQNYGNLGDLKTAIVEDGAANPLETSYYRYYTSGESGGYQHGLKFAFRADSYARLVAAVGDPTTATDSAVAPYANNFFAYDSQYRATEEIAQGAGCSACSGGLGTFTYAYTTSSNTPGYNSWTVRMVETLPDSNQNIVYTNAYGQVMLSVFHDTTTDQSWGAFYQYDSQGRVLLQANPSAVSGYNDSYADLLHNVSGSYQYLNDSTGLLAAYSYATTTTATESAPGSVAGYLQTVSIQLGELGMSIPQESWQYFSRTASGSTVHPVATDTVYRNTNGTGEETTSYTYSWFSGTTQEQSVTRYSPGISTEQNGSGTVSVTTVVFDGYGRPIWTKNAGGYLNYLAYDQASGAVVTQIIDVNTALTSQFTGLPSGWSTPSDGGLHLVTQLQVDALGHTVAATDPNGNLTYTVYIDAAHEVRVYPSWNSSTHTPTGPNQVYREDWSHSYTETLTLTATPHLTGGLPDGSEALSGLQTLSRSHVNAAGQFVALSSYFNLSGLGYSTSGMGSLNTHFYQTQYGYDTRGRPNKVASPTGTITRTVSDGLGRVRSVWVGVNDTPTSGYWSPSNPAGMTKVEAAVYDGGGVGDSNLTQQIAYPGNGAADRVTQTWYDWRNRAVAVKGGVQTTESATVNRPLTHYDYDNLNEVTRTRTYDGDGVAPADPNGDGIIVTGSAGWAFTPAAGVASTVSAVATDAAGNLYVAGEFNGTADFDPSPGVVSLASSSGGSFVAKYSSAGTLVGVSQSSVHFATEVATETALAVDGVGNVYTGGYLTSGAACVWKLDAWGDTVWVAQGGSLASVVEVAVDGAGNVYATGPFRADSTFGSTTLTVTSTQEGNVFVWKLDGTEGSTEWAVQAGGDEDGWEGNVLAFGLGVSSSGTVFVTGTLSGAGWFGGTYASAVGNQDAYLWALDASDGSTTGLTQSGGSGAQVSPTGLTIAGTNDVYVGGYFLGNVSFGGTALTATVTKAFVWKLDGSDSSTEWAVAAGGGSGSWVTPQGAPAVTATGDVYVTGSFHGTAAFGGTSLTATDYQDLFVWKLASADGSTQGVTASRGGTSGTHQAIGLAASVSGELSLYVGGTLQGTNATAIVGETRLTSPGSTAGYVWRVEPTLPSYADQLRAETRVDFDDQGRPYRSTRYNVELATGAVPANGLVTQVFYDQRGHVLKTSAPGGLVQKATYDGADRVTAVYTSDGGGDSNWSGARNRCRCRRRTIGCGYPALEARLLLIRGLLEEVAQVIGHILAGRVAIRGPPGQGFQADTFLLLRDGVMPLPGRAHLAMNDLFQHFLHLVGLEGKLAGEQLVEDYAEAEVVRPPIDSMALAPRLLGTHVGGRPGVAWSLADILFPQGKPEIGHEGLAAGVEKNVAGLDVPMENSLLVGIVQRLGHRRHQLGRICHGRPVGLDPLRQGAAFDELGDDEAGVVLGAANVMHRHDVGVVEVGDGAGFGQVGFGICRA